jgi:transposase
MLWFWVWQVVSTLIELVRLGRRSESDKDLEILLLRRQLGIYERKQERALHLSRGEKLTLVVLATKLKARTGRTIKAMGDVIRIVKPATLFRWHNQLVRRKWAYRHRNAGRPQIDKEIQQLVLRLARENDWGYERIEGELHKLGYTISHETVGNILRRHDIPPAPERETSPSWRHLMTHYKDQLLACDFFTVETLFLQTIYVLFFIEIGSRRVHFAGCNAHPDSAWVTQQARQVMWELEDREPTIRFLIRDNGSMGANMPLPIPKLVFGSLLTRWMDFTKQALPKETIMEFINYYVLLNEHDIETHILNVKDGGTEIGFTGYATFALSKSNKQTKKFAPDLARTLRQEYDWYARMIHLLADFAFYSSVGRKTTTGMGGVRLMK